MHRTGYSGLDLAGRVSQFAGIESGPCWGKVGFVVASLAAIDRDHLVIVHWMSSKVCIHDLSLASRVGAVCVVVLGLNVTGAHLPAVAANFGLTCCNLLLLASLHFLVLLRCVGAFTALAPIKGPLAGCGLQSSFCQFSLNFSKRFPYMLLPRNRFDPFIFISD